MSRLKTTILHLVFLVVFSCLFSPAYSFSNKNSISTPNSINSEQREVRKNFDYYVLALSWSPAYCRSKPNDKDQCLKKAYRFVIHGLWPNRNQQKPPFFCAATEKVPPTIVEKIFPYMPSEKLMNHEWAKHGSCSGLNQEMYFNESVKLYQKIKFPEIFYKNTVRFIRAKDLIAALKRSNSFLATSDSIRIAGKNQKKSRKILQEIRICYNKELTAPIDCPFPKLTRHDNILDIIPPNIKRAA